MDKIKEFDIFYFTGTGNARTIANWFSEFASEKGIDCKVNSIAKICHEPVEIRNPETLIMIISPVHGFNYPKITLDFISRLPHGSNRIVLANTRAGLRIGSFVTPGLTGIGFLLSSAILKRKGYKVVGQIPFDMPSNWISIHPALRKKGVKFLHKVNHGRVAKHANKIFKGESDFLAYRDLIQDILISPISLGYYIYGRFVLAKSFYASVKCDNCGLCIKQCPVGAIKTLNGRPFWKIQCESCMKCMNSCPRKAIETAHGMFVVVGLLCSLTLTIIADKFVHNTIQSGFLHQVMLWLLFFFFTAVLYRMQHFLLRNRYIGRFISYFSLTYYKFWGRYKSIQDKHWK